MPDPSTDFSTRFPSICVTGSAGFIGGHVVKRLLELGVRVLGIDNLDPFYDIARKRRVIAECEQAGGNAFEHAEIDICDQPVLRDALLRAKPTAIVHLAAKAGVRPSIEDPLGYAQANVTGTASVLAASNACGCETLAVASSSSVYGNNPKAPFSETDDVSRPISPYAATKLATEALCHTHHHLTGSSVGCLRFFTVYGPAQRPDLAIGRFIDSIRADEPITMFGDGSTSRDYTYIDDIVAGVLASLERIRDHGYRVWNLGSDRPTRLDTLIETIASVVGKPAMIEQAPMQPGDVERTWADLSRVEEELGYKAATPLEDGVAAQLAWLESERASV